MTTDVETPVADGRSRTLRQYRREPLAALPVVVVSALLGGPVGLLWGHLAPRATATVSNGSASLGEDAGRSFIGGDLAFLVVGLVVGLVIGVATLRRSGPGVVVGLAAGGGLGSEIARLTGHLIGRDDVRALARSMRDGSVEFSPAVHTWQVLLAWPLAAVAVHLVKELARTSGPAPLPGTGPGVASSG